MLFFYENKAVILNTQGNWRAELSPEARRPLSCTSMSTSVAVQSVTSAMVCSLPGLIVSKVLPDATHYHAPKIHTNKELTFVPSCNGVLCEGSMALSHAARSRLWPKRPGWYSLRAYARWSSRQQQRTSGATVPHSSHLFVLPRTGASLAPIDDTRHPPNPLKCVCITF